MGALIEEARALDRVGQRQDARERYEAVLHGEHDLSTLVASRLLRWIAASYTHDGDYLASADCAHAAIACAELSGDRAALGHALNVMGIVRWRQGAFDECVELFNEALTRGASTDDPRLQADVMMNLGVVASIRGDFLEALRYYQDALTHGRLHSLLDKVLRTLSNLGVANIALGRLEAADEAFSEALAIANALGDLSFRIMLEVNCAALEIEKHDFAEAKRRCDRAMELAEHLEDSHANGEAQKVYGIIARETGDLARAEEHLARARDIGVEAGDLHLEGEVNRELAELYSRLGRNRETLQALNRAHGCFTHLSARHDLADVGRRMSCLEGDFLEVVRAWGESIEAKDVHTQGHCKRVADLASALAEKVGIGGTSLFWFRIGALLHDVGKLIVPSDVLNKASELTSAEWDLMRRHPSAGEEMLADVDFPWDVAPMVRSHHERWDGGGYPDGLSGEDIPLPARVLAVADAYDALTTQRSYNHVYAHAEAIEIMRRDVGTQFEPRLFALFEELMRDGHATAPVHARRPDATNHRVSGAHLIDLEQDDLTGALVRRSFVEMATQVLAARRDSVPVSLLVIDVDEFKTVNDRHGHLTGDDALRRIGDMVSEFLDPGQHLGRYAGDEFVVLLPGLSADQAAKVARALRIRVAAEHIPVREHPEHVVGVTLSIGVAASPLDGTTFELLFAAADRALFEAKRAGRNTVMVAREIPDASPVLTVGTFVGRETELRGLTIALQDAVKGAPQVRLVVGEAGVGKSTFVRQLASHAGAFGAVTLTGRALESDQPPAFGPWAEIVSQINELALVPPGNWPSLGRLVPALQRADISAPAAGVDPLQEHQLLRELGLFLRAASRERPLQIVFEDMHWASGASWEALEYLVTQATTERIFIVLTLRSEDAAHGGVRERRQRLSRYGQVRELFLHRLTEPDVAQWLRATLQCDELPRDLLDFTIRHTEGNPFLVLQLVRAMETEGTFRHDGSAWTWTVPEHLALPAGMTDLLGRRLSRLSPETMRVLVAAAVIGRTFPVALIAHATGASMDTVLDAVDAALATSVLEPVRGAESDSYQFAHSLLVDATLNTVSPTRRRLLHERIGDLLAQQSPNDVDAIAAHYARSGNSAKAFRACRSAARDAIARHALDEAASLLRLAVARAANDGERENVNESLSAVVERAGRWVDVARVCDDILAIPTLAHQPARVLSVTLRRLDAQARLGIWSPDAESICRALLASAEQLGTPGDVLRARALLAQALVESGATNDAISIAQDSRRLADAMDDEELRDEATYRLALTLRNEYPTDATDLLLVLLDSVRRSGDRALEARVLLALGIAGYDATGGHGALHDALAIARQSHALDVAAEASMHIGVAAMRAGEFAVAHAALGDAHELYTRLRHDVRRLDALQELASLERARGEYIASIRRYSEAATLAGALGARESAVRANAGAGLAALALGNLTAAQISHDSAMLTLDTAEDTWFDGRELLEALAIRLATEKGDHAGALARFTRTLQRLESGNGYAAACLAADCAASLVKHEPSVHIVIEQVGADTRVERFPPLLARFQAVRDLAEQILDERP